MIRVKNLEGRSLWTFPKGHLEKGETDAQAALREVHEETGWKCRIASSRKPFAQAHYRFKRKNKLVNKTVVWFRMRPGIRNQARDASEVLKVGWFSLKTAKEKVRYPSDEFLLQKLQSS